MSEGFNDAAKTVMVHKIAGAVDEYLTPFIEPIIRQAKEEAWDEGYGVGFLDAMLVRRPQPNPYREQEEA